MFMVSSTVKALLKSFLIEVSYFFLTVSQRNWIVEFKNLHKMRSAGSDTWFSRRFLEGTLLVG